MVKTMNDERYTMNYAHRSSFIVPPYNGGIMASIFSKIVSGEIPSIKIDEDEQTLAFMDINPAARGHVLVISKAEYPDLWTIPPETLAAVAITTQRVALAIRAALGPDGLNIIQSNGAAAGQVVFHYHVHLIPRWEGDQAVHLWRPQQADQDELRATAEKIRGSLGGA
jgi:histidine triad (HIT) family protein